MFKQWSWPHVNTFRPKEGGKQKRQAVYRVFFCPEASVIYKRPCVSAADSSSLPWSLLLLPCHSVLQPWRLRMWVAGSDPAPGPASLWDEGCGMAAQVGFAGWCVGDAPTPQGCLPNRPTPLSQDTPSGILASAALSHPSLGRGSGNAAVFSGCSDFCLFFKCCCFPEIPEKGLAGHAGLSAVNSQNPCPKCGHVLVCCALGTCSQFGANSTPRAQTMRFKVNKGLAVISYESSGWSSSFFQQQR